MKNKNNLLYTHIENLLLYENHSLNGLESLKLTFIKDILDMFHQYPTLHSICIDPDNITTLKDTWEGVPDLSIIDIEQIAWDSVENIKQSSNYQDYILHNTNASFNDYLKHYLEGKNDLSFIPYYSNSTNSELRNTNLLPYNIKVEDSNIQYSSLHNIHMHLHDNFYYLADSDKQSDQFVDDYKKRHNQSTITFNYYNEQGILNLNFHDDIYLFLGKDLSSLLSYNILESAIPQNIINKKILKVKI